MQNSLNRIEFYERGGALIASCFTAAVPRKGEYINIDRRQWKVAFVQWALDKPSRRYELRANVELEKVPEDEIGPD